jgi:hypothetical protein
VKTNVSHLYPLGRKVADLSYGQLVKEVAAQEPIKQFEPSMLPEPELTFEPEKKRKSLQDLLDKAEEYGISEVHMSKAAARYCNGKRLEQLNENDIELLFNRLVESRGSASGVSGATEQGGQENPGRAGRAGVTDVVDTVDLGEAIDYEERVVPTATGRSNGRGRG